VSHNVAVVVTRGGIVSPGEAAVSPSRVVRKTWVIAREHGEWLVTAFHDSRVTPC
jgi:uncharacterized protein (TIGR02246 family)